jgi:hypothetical protein
MNRTTNSADDLAILRKICDASLPQDQRFALLESIQNYVLSNAEHQVVFESIRFLFSRGPISPARLSAHLNNRGFPDVSMEKYFPAATEYPRPQEDTTKTTT